jgi:hypothetical protein
MLGVKQRKRPTNEHWSMKNRMKTVPSRASVYKDMALGFSGELKPRHFKQPVEPAILEPTPPPLASKGVFDAVGEGAADRRMSVSALVEDRLRRGGAARSTGAASSGPGGKNDRRR